LVDGARGLAGGRHGVVNPVERLTAGLPRGYRVTIDWLVTILGALVIVVAIKQWIVNPYRIPSSSMEPTLSCARPAVGCLARGGLFDGSDRVLACRVCYDFSAPARGDVVVFTAPPLAASMCGEGGTYVKRLIGLPGDTVHEDRHGFIWINGRKLDEPYVTTAHREADVRNDPDYLGRTWHVPAGRYFFMGDNRGGSCDSRAWGTVLRGSLIGKVIATYWPPTRISIR
jgi:signal peptidase I